jgi:iron(III) transport system substrate-binding protein
LLAAAVIGCAEKIPPKVVVYTTVDREIALPLFAEFTKATGIQVRANYGTTPPGSLGLAREIVTQREHPRCDLFWNDEVMSTLWLEREGLLRPFDSPAAANFPASARSPQGNWYGLASEARVLVINTRQIAEDRRPKSIQDLTDPQWYERTAIAKPLYGASASQAACLFAAWGDDKAREFFVAVKRVARILPNDREVAHAVATGSLAFGLTNSADAIVELAAGAPITIVYPDQADDDPGTLFIPSTVALIKDSPHPEPAEQMLNYLLSAEVARQLAAGRDALIPLRTGVPASDRVKTPAQVRAMEVDFSAAAEHWDATDKFLQEEFVAP